MIIFELWPSSLAAVFSRGNILGSMNLVEKDLDNRLSPGYFENESAPPS